MKLSALGYPPAVMAVMMTMSSASARAQSESDPFVSLDAEHAGKIAKFVSSCVYRTRPAAVALLLNNSDSISIDFKAAKTSYKTFSRDFNLVTCIGNETQFTGGGELNVQFSPMRMRQALVEQAYLTTHPAAPQLSSSATLTVSRAYMTAGSSADQAQIFAAFADCLVFRNTSGADALVRTVAGTPQELAAARSLAPVLGSCLTEGEKINLTPATIRIFAADGLWNRYKTSAVSAAVR